MARIALIALLVSGCVAGGGISILTNPAKYLRNYPLDTASEAEVIAELGPPDQELPKQDGKWLVYEIGEGWGLRTYTFMMRDGFVSDILYNDQGPYNGITARELQSNP